MLEDGKDVGRVRRFWVCNSVTNGSIEVVGILNVEVDGRLELVKVAKLTFELVNKNEVGSTTVLAGVV